jgi:hypothetical protein
MKAGDGRSCLRDLVHMFRISFRLRPTYVSLASDRPEIGFEMELVGTHAMVGQHVHGGCAQCLRVLLVLLELADQSLPGEGTAARHIGTRCEKLIRYASSGGDRPEVALGMTVVRGASREEIAGDQMWQFTEDIRKVLRDLGCREMVFDCSREPGLCDSAILAGRTA